ncbi:hypothetical protein LINPERPRIM_LOCUS29324 [Linum perenne]
MEEYRELPCSNLAAASLATAIINHQPRRHQPLASTPPSSTASLVAAIINRQPRRRHHQPLASSSQASPSTSLLPQTASLRSEIRLSRSGRKEGKPRRCIRSATALQPLKDQIRLHHQICHRAPTLL